MTKFSKFIKALLCSCMLLTGMMIQPMNAKAEETVTPYAAARSMEIPSDTRVAFEVQKEGYALNYVFYYVSGTYVYNTSSSGNYVSNVNLTLTKINSVSSPTKNFSTNGQGIYEVVSLTPQTYTAGSNYSITINYESTLRLTSGTNLGIAYNSTTISGVQG